MILNLLKKLGRLRVLVDYWGVIIWERYFLGYIEEEKPTHWWHWLPNVWIHRFPVPATPDAADPHRHAYSAITIVLKGSYTDVVNFTERRKVNFISFHSYKDNHRIETVEEGTITLFIHGFRKQEWHFVFKPCETICQACGSTRDGVCFKADNPEMEMVKVLDLADAAKWYKWDKASEKKIRLRQKAVEKKGLIPLPKPERPEIMKNRFITNVSKDN
jgi:hypothetical protein